MSSLTDYPSWLPVRARHKASFALWLDDFERAGGVIKQNVVRNTTGCDLCRRESVPDLNGYAGRTVVAEILNPHTNRDWLGRIAQYGISDF